MFIFQGPGFDLSKVQKQKNEPLNASASELSIKCQETTTTATTNIISNHPEAQIATKNMPQDQKNLYIIKNYPTEFKTSFEQVARSNGMNEEQIKQLWNHFQTVYVKELEMRVEQQQNNMRTFMEAKKGTDTQNDISRRASYGANVDYIVRNEKSSKNIVDENNRKTLANWKMKKLT